MATVALGWQVYALTGSAFHLGLIGLVQFLPVALLVFVAGHAADRYDRQRVVQVCQIVQAIAAAFLCWGSCAGLADGAGDLCRGGAARGRHRLRVAGDRGAADRRGAAGAVPAGDGALDRHVPGRGDLRPGARRLRLCRGAGAALRDHGGLLADRQRPERRDPAGGAGGRPAAAAARRPLRRHRLRAQRPGDPRDDLARPLRGAARRGDGADADLRPRHPAHRPLGPRRAARRRRRSGRWR